MILCRADGRKRRQAESDSEDSVVSEESDSKLAPPPPNSAPIFAAPSAFSNVNSSDVISIFAAAPNLEISQIIYINNFYYGFNLLGECGDVTRRSDDQCVVNGFSVSQRAYLTDCNGDDSCDDVSVPIALPDEPRCDGGDVSRQFMHVDYQCIDGE